MKPYLLGYDIFHFVDSSLTCPPYHIVEADDFVGSSPHLNPSFLHWK